MEGSTLNFFRSSRVCPFERRSSSSKKKFPDVSELLDFIISIAALPMISQVLVNFAIWGDMLDTAFELIRVLGQIEFTAIPYSLNSYAIPITIIDPLNLDREYPRGLVSNILLQASLSLIGNGGGTKNRTCGLGDFYKCGKANFVNKNGARTVIPKLKSSSLVEMFSTDLGTRAPALFTTISMRPNFSMARFITPCKSSSLLTSHLIGKAFAPSFAILLSSSQELKIVSFALGLGSIVFEATITLIPFMTNSLHIANPIPLLPPVTKAT
jgi:hypothetical protein